MLFQQKKNVLVLDGFEKDPEMPRSDKPAFVPPMTNS